VGYLPQEASVFRRLTVEDNLRVGLELAGKTESHIQAKIKELSEELHIVKFCASRQMSFLAGKARRVEIARAMASEPKFILLDEPFTGIDPVTIEEIQRLFLKLKARGIGILIHRS